MIPHQNVKNLMLNEEVLKAIQNDKFNVYSVKTIDEGIEVLMGIPAGKLDEDGRYPQGTIHYLVNEKLEEIANIEKKTQKDK